jgi:hypothetical protein
MLFRPQVCRIRAAPHLSNGELKYVITQQLHALIDHDAGTQRRSAQAQSESPATAGSPGLHSQKQTRGFRIQTPATPSHIGLH